MLKKISGILFLGLMVFAGSSCVTPTHASSAPSVIIVRIQAGGLPSSQSDPAGSAVEPPPLQELVTLYNQSLSPVDLTDWCLVNKYNVGFACFTDELGLKGYVLPPQRYVNVISTGYISANYPLVAAGPRPWTVPGSHTYMVSNQSSGAIVGGSDDIRLVSSDGVVVSRHFWSASLAGGSSLQRKLLYTNPDTYSVLGPEDWSVVSQPGIMPEGSLEVYSIHEYSDSDDDSEGGGEGGDENGGGGYDSGGDAGGEDGDGANGDGDGTEIGGSGPKNNDTPALSHSSLVITEILPNPKGSDVGSEFIEFYNSGDEEIELGGYRVAINKELTKWIDLPSGLRIGAGEHIAVYNKAPLNFSLVNTNGFVRLYKGSEPMGQPITYSSPKDDQSWSLVGDLWLYTRPPSPGLKNVLSTYSASSSALLLPTGPVPCNEGQYRSVETGRCRKVESETLPAPCKEGYERNQDTGRCRKIVLASSPVPCKDGYERNAETGRCRKKVQMTQAGHGLEGQESSSKNQPRWYYWAGIALVVLLVVGYGVWEWRQEILSGVRRVASVFAKH